MGLGQDTGDHEAAQPLLEEALPGLAYLYGEDHHHTRGIQYR